MEENTVPSVFDDLANDRSRFEYATVGQRFVNFIVDSIANIIFFYLVVFTTSIIMAFSGSNQEDIMAIYSNKLFIWTLYLLCFIVAYTIIEGITKGRSLGKLITGTKAVTEDLLPISWRDAFIRTLCRLIPFETLSAFGGHPWHDGFSKTIVIKKMQPPP
jgi:uncharacterized RDD family membrane protein YckC